MHGHGPVVSTFRMEKRGESATVRTVTVVFLKLCGPSYDRVSFQLQCGAPFKVMLWWSSSGLVLLVNSLSASSSPVYN